MLTGEAARRWSRPVRKRFSAIHPETDFSREKSSRSMRISLSTAFCSPSAESVSLGSLPGFSFLQEASAHKNPNKYLNAGQLVPKISGCRRCWLTATSTLCFCPLNWIARSITRADLSRAPPRVSTSRAPPRVSVTRAPPRISASRTPLRVGPVQLSFVSTGPAQLTFISAGPAQLSFVSAGPVQLTFVSAGSVQLPLVSAGSVQFSTSRAPPRLSASRVPPRLSASRVPHENHLLQSAP